MVNYSPPKELLSASALLVLYLYLCNALFFLRRAWILLRVKYNLKTNYFLLTYRSTPLVKLSEYNYCLVRGMNFNFRKIIAIIRKGYLFPGRTVFIRNRCNIDVVISSGIIASSANYFIINNGRIKTVCHKLFMVKR